MAELTVGELLKRTETPMIVWNSLLSAGVLMTHYNGNEFIGLYQGEKVVVTQNVETNLFNVTVGGMLFTSHAAAHNVGRCAVERRHIGLFE